MVIVFAIARAPQVCGDCTQVRQARVSRAVREDADGELSRCE